MRKIAFKARLRAAGMPTADIQAISMEATPEVTIEITTTAATYYVYLTGIMPPTLMEKVVQVIQAEPDQERAAHDIADTLASEVIGSQVRAVVVRKKSP